MRFVGEFFFPQLEMARWTVFRCSGQEGEVRFSCRGSCGFHRTGRSFAARAEDEERRGPLKWNDRLSVLHGGDLCLQPHTGL